MTDDGSKEEDDALYVAVERLEKALTERDEALSQVVSLTDLNKASEQAMRSAAAAAAQHRRSYQAAVGHASKMEAERDEYRSMLSDLLATMGPQWARARALLGASDDVPPTAVDRARDAFIGFLSSLGVMPELRDDDLEYLWNHVGGATGFVRPLIAEIVRRRAAETSERDPLDPTRAVSEGGGPEHRAALGIDCRSCGAKAGTWCPMRWREWHLCIDRLIRGTP